MILLKRNGRYEFICEKDQRRIPSDAGFIFDRVWWTRSAHQALKLAKYADDTLRAEMIEKALTEPDPEKVTLRLEGAIWRYYAPINHNAPAQDAKFQFKKEPLPHWWTESRYAAARCYCAAADLADFVCSQEDREALKGTK